QAGVSLFRFRREERWLREKGRRPIPTPAKSGNLFLWRLFEFQQFRRFVDVFAVKSALEFHVISSLLGRTLKRLAKNGFADDSGFEFLFCGYVQYHLTEFPAFPSTQVLDRKVRHIGHVQYRRNRRESRLLRNNVRSILLKEADRF